MTIRRALSVTTAVAATAPIDPPRAIPPGLFPDKEPQQLESPAESPI